MDRRGCILSRTPLVSAAALLLVGACKKGDVPDPPGGDPQVWVHVDGTLNRDEAWGVDRTANGDVIVGEHRAYPSQLDVLATRYDPVGDIVWQQRWGEVLDEQARVVHVDGSVAYLGGRKYLFADVERSEALLLDLDVDTGEVLEVTRDNSSQVIDSIEGIVTVGGQVYASGEAGGDALLLQVSGGAVTNRLEWGLPEDWDQGSGDLVAIGDTLVFAGRTGSLTDLDDRDAMLVAVSASSLDEQWTAKFGDIAVLEALGGLATDGQRLFGVGVAGDPLGNLGDDLLLLASDADGNWLWDTRLPGTASARAIEVDPADGNLVVAATLDGDMWMLRVDADTGEVLEDVTWGGSGDDVPLGLVVVDDHAVVVGRTQSTGGGKDDSMVVSMGLCPFSLPPFP